MQVVHTAGVPPNQGSTYLLSSGCTSNSKNALKKIVSAKTQLSQPNREVVFIGRMNWWISRYGNSLKLSSQPEQPEPGRE